MTAREIMDTWSDRMGWSMATELSLALEFISTDSRQETEFDTFLKDKAREDIEADYPIGLSDLELK